MGQNLGHELQLADQAGKRPAAPCPTSATRRKLRVDLAGQVLGALLGDADRLRDRVDLKPNVHSSGAGIDILGLLVLEPKNGKQPFHRCKLLPRLVEREVRGVLHGEVVHVRAGAAERGVVGCSALAKHQTVFVNDALQDPSPALLHRWRLAAAERHKAIAVVAAAHLVPPEVRIFLRIGPIQEGI